jgi:hypothetical protein
MDSSLQQLALARSEFNPRISAKPKVNYNEFAALLTDQSGSGAADENGSLPAEVSLGTISLESAARAAAAMGTSGGSAQSAPELANPPKLSNVWEIPIGTIDPQPSVLPAPGTIEADSGSTTPAGEEVAFVYPAQGNPQEIPIGTVGSEPNPVPAPGAGESTASTPLSNVWETPIATTGSETGAIAAPVELGPIGSSGSLQKDLLGTIEWKADAVATPGLFGADDEVVKTADRQGQIRRAYRNLHQNPTGTLRTI